MTFRTFIGIWILILIVGALSLHKSPPPSAYPISQQPKQEAQVRIEKPAWQVADEERDEARRIAAQRFAEAIKLEDIRKNKKALQAAIQDLQEPISIPSSSVNSRPLRTTYSYSYRWWSTPRPSCNPFSPRCNY